MKFRYIGEEFTEWFGFKWMPGTVHDVEDGHAVGKLKNSALFEVCEEVTYGGPVAGSMEDATRPKNKGGRPRKVVEVEAESDGDDQE